MPTIDIAAASTRFGMGARRSKPLRAHMGSPAYVATRHICVDCPSAGASPLMHATGDDQ